MALRIAYAANLLILFPVCWSMFFGRGMTSVFEGKVAESDGLRLLVGSLWFTILTASVEAACSYSARSGYLQNGLVARVRVAFAQAVGY